jgi:Phage integrase family
VKALTEKELRALIEAVPAERRLLVTLLAQAGLRVSELLPLRWADIDFGRRRLRVRRSLSRGQIGAPKTRHGRRDVPLTEAMTRALWNARKAPGVDGRDEALIFPGRDGGYLDRTQVFRVVKAAAATAGVPWAGLHTLRHSAATILFRRGWNAVQVQKFLGHHSPAFTLAVYVHLLPDDLPEPDFLDEALGGTDEAFAVAQPPEAEAATTEGCRRIVAGKPLGVLNEGLVRPGCTGAVGGFESLWRPRRPGSESGSSPSASLKEEVLYERFPASRPGRQSASRCRGCRGDIRDRLGGAGVDPGLVRGDPRLLQQEGGR